MTELIIALRLLHIVSGAFWVGAVITAVFFIEPAATDLGVQGERFLAHLVIRRKAAVVLAVAATTAIAAGAALYWIDSGGLRIEWITSHTGIGFTAGAFAAITAYAIALVVLKPEVDRLAGIAHGSTDDEIGRQLASEQTDRSARRLRRWSLIQVAILLFAIAAMATARYLP